MWAYKGELYNGKPASDGDHRGDSQIQASSPPTHYGIAGRGVLLDILPVCAGWKWLEPGEAVTPRCWNNASRPRACAWEKGDILVFRTGHHRAAVSNLDHGTTGTQRRERARPACTPTAILLLHERKVAAFFPDGDGETVPSNVDRIAYPVHVSPDCRHGNGLRRQPESRGHLRRMRGRAPLGILRRGCAAPITCGNRVLLQPYRDPLTHPAIKLGLQKIIGLRRTMELGMTI